MNIKLINPIEFPSWNQQVAQLCGATIFHSANWARLLHRSYGYKPRYFCTFSNGRLTNLVPVMEVKGSIVPKRGVSLPFSDQVVPLVGDKNYFDQIFDAISDYGQRNGWRTITFHGGDGFFESEKSYASYISPYINLDLSSQTLLKLLRSSTRRNIFKAKKNGVKVVITNSFTAMKDFYRLHCLTRREHGIPPQPDYFFENLHKEIIADKKGMICLGYYKGKLIAGVLFLTIGQHAIYKYGASDKRYLHLRPNNLVMWEAIIWALENCIRTIDFGRTEMHHRGQIQFKRGWHTSELKINYYKFDIRKREFLSSPPKIKSSYAAFKKCPMPLLRLIGKISYRHLG